MSEQSRATKILFVEADQLLFEIRQCVARVLPALPTVEMFHAKDATEALAVIERHCPDIVVIDDELSAERDLLLETVDSGGSTVVLRVDEEGATPPAVADKIARIPKSDTLDGIHQTLKFLAMLSGQEPVRSTEAVH